MRLLISTFSIISAGFVLGAHAESMSAETNCGDSLRARLVADPKVQGTCFAKVSVNGATVTKNYHVAVEVDRVGGTGATLAVREVCETCKTTGPVERQAIDYKKLANWALANASQSLAKGENVSVETSSDDDDEQGQVVVPRRPVDSCSSKSTASDRISCRISKLNAEHDVTKMRDYYLSSLQPDLQKLAVSKSETDQALLRQSIMTMLTSANGVTESDVAIKSSVYEYNSFLEMRHYAALDPSAAYREMIKNKYETIFRNRPMYNRQNGIQNESLDGNSRLLLKLTGEELNGSGDKSLASAGGPTGTNPRGQFGTPGLQQGRGFTPPSTRPGTAVGTQGGLDRIFHKN